MKGLFLTIILFFTGHPHQRGQSLKATATAHSVTLSWTQGVVQAGATCPAGSGTTNTAVTGNNIYRGTTAGGEGSTAIASIPANVTYVDTAVVAGQMYFYQLTSVNCSGESNPRSSEVSVTVPNPVAPSAPTGVTVVTQ